MVRLDTRRCGIRKVALGNYKMSKLLFDEYPLVVQPTLARAIGLHEAIVLQQINYWLNLQKGGEIIDGKKWIYNSLSDWQEQFPFLSESSIYRAMENLEWANLIKTGNYNKRKGDKTKWYTINQETVDLLYALVEHEKEIKEMESAAVPTWNNLFQDETGGSQNGTPSSQNETTLPEITTETISDNNNSQSDDCLLEEEKTAQELWDEMPSANNAETKDDGLIPITNEEKHLFEALNIERTARNYSLLVRFKTTKQREKFRECVSVFNGSTDAQVDDIISNGKRDIESVVNALFWRVKNSKPYIPNQINKPNETMTKSYRDSLVNMSPLPT